MAWITQCVLLVGIIAVAVNEHLKRRADRKVRDRDYRRKVYVNFVTATGSRQAVNNQSEANQLIRELGVALATMRITSTPPVINTAQCVYDIVRAYLHGIFIGNDINRYYTIVLEDASGFKDALDAFIAAARREDECDSWVRSARAPRIRLDE